MGYILTGGEVYTSQKILKDATIKIDNQVLTKVSDQTHKNQTHTNKDHQVIDLSGYKVLPGLFDLHIHGVNGHDTLDGSFHALNEMSIYLAKYGVTSFLAATVTADKTKIHNAVENVADSMDKGLDGATLWGSYVEGPYITPEYKGAHPDNFIRELDMNEIERIIKRSRETVKVLALAPEKKNASKVISYLKSKGIKIALGHSNATYAEATKAIENGADIAVHTFNGMRGLHHREPGLVGAVLNNDNIKAEIIADGVHVDIPVMQILKRCKSKEDIILVTDCMRAGGLEDGEYNLGELKVWVKDNVARVESGSLAGSTLRLIDGVKNMVEKAKTPLQDAVNMASLNPARTLNLDKTVGSIEEGKWADIIAIDDNYNVVFTMVNGKIVHDIREVN